MKAFETKDDSLGIIELPKGHKVKVTVKDGRKVLEKIEMTIEDIAELIPLGEKILDKILALFNVFQFLLIT